MSDTTTGKSLFFNEVLKHRINRNYAAFVDEITTLEKGAIFRMAALIAATTSIHALMTSMDWLSEEDAQFLLQCGNPLSAITNCWRCYKTSNGADFEAFISAYAADVKQYHVTRMAVIDEARNDYGIDATVCDETISDIVDICSRLLPKKNCYNDYAKGGGFCPRA